MNAGLGCLHWYRLCTIYLVGYILSLIQHLGNRYLNILAECEVLLCHFLLLSCYTLPQVQLLLLVLLVSVDNLRLGDRTRRHGLRHNIFSQLLLLLLLHCRSQRHLLNLQLLCFLIHQLLIANHFSIIPLLHWQCLQQLLICLYLTTNCIIKSTLTTTQTSPITILTLVSLSLICSLS